MKKIIYLPIFLMTVLSFVPAGAENVRVVTKENAIREQCRFLSGVKAKVSYNDSLEKKGAEGDWIKVKFKGVSGCIHKSAVDEKTVSLSGVAGSGSKASADEVALAGKGFNPQVEESFKKNHPDLDFRIVDKIEKYQLSEESLRDFISNGGLNQPK